MPGHHQPLLAEENLLKKLTVKKRAVAA
ncbi:hypothetical protein AZE42_14178 [Rhizopogon vesiculosus]|uniref:Uncharacterized protein n=1 Tax=Rhizopogon vesiculosus TaxID=180088 RepID=A0A1J8Q2A3_9AGAM|nr:hypothetical protein AZE42_14178 [Rhizopogon vesiculosus]